VNWYRSKKKLLTLEELYVEILYTILHMLGCDKDKVLVHHLCSVGRLCYGKRIGCSIILSFLVPLGGAGGWVNC
jgi:hypothetical protein